jgi:hypothetical protein
VARNEFLLSDLLSQYRTLLGKFDSRQLNSLLADGAPNNFPSKVTVIETEVLLANPNGIAAWASG